MAKWVYFAVSVVVIGVIAYFVYQHRAWLGLGSAGGGVPTEEASTDQQPAHLSWHATYAVAWDDNPPVERASAEAVERTLDNARDGALARTQTTLIGESHANYLGYPSRDFSGENQSGGLFNARLILKGTRLYMMIAAFPAPSARRDEDVTHFFDSFKLTSTARGE